MYKTHEGLSKEYEVSCEELDFLNDVAREEGVSDAFAAATAVVVRRTHEFVHRRIVQQRDAGTAVVLVSTELDEVYALADRIAVMYRGRIMAVVPPTVGAEDLGLLMAGVMPENLTQYLPGGAG